MHPRGAWDPVSIDRSANGGIPVALLPPSCLGRAEAPPPAGLAVRGAAPYSSPVIIRLSGAKG
jgi:hypothetical protein